MLKIFIGILIGLCLASIPINRLQMKVGHLESTWISCLNNRGIVIDKQIHLCLIPNTYININDKGTS